jgi:hypothetical protein
MMYVMKWNSHALSKQDGYFSDLTTTTMSQGTVMWNGDFFGIIHDA